MKKFIEVQWSSKLRPAHKPMWTFAELCEELGVKRHVMVSYMVKDPSHPKAFVRSAKNKNTWYDPEAFRAWFKQYKEREQNGI